MRWGFQILKNFKNRTIDFTQRHEGAKDAKEKIQK
ncbi:MAG: hypothetical protein JWQ27_1348 [Ferruginibacter sp.]|nr:hypothetical protein [Ferruginibacter sp.]